jgi:RNA polymerase sigma-70 factor (ECF subfamily)
VERDDGKLVAEILGGSTPAFEELVRRHRRLVYRIAYGLTRDPDGALETVQDTFLKVHERLRHYRGEGDVKSWIARIAANEALNRARDRRRREAREQLVPIAETQGPSQQRVLERRESDAALHQSIALLPERQRLAVVLRYFEDQSPREIAAVLECSEETARNTLFRGLRRLRSVLTESEEARP